MPAASEVTIQNQWVQLALAGTVNEDDIAPKIVKLQPDRALTIFSQLAALSDGRQRIIVADANGILRVRPYEAQHPVDGVLMPLALTTIYTEADGESRFVVEVVNNSGAAATCQVRRFVNSGSAGFDILGAGSPVPTVGPGIRLGPYDLLDTGKVTAASSPANSCTIHLTIDRFNASGDTP